MSWVTILWSMNAAACLTLAAIYLLVWSKRREDWVHLLFSFTAISVAVIAGFELAVMRSETTEQFGTLMRWAHVPIWALIVSLVWFVRLRLRAGRMWLAWGVCALRSLALFLNFLFSPNLNYRQITSLQQVSWWGGEKVSVAIGVPNPWTLIGHLGLLLLLVFLIDATVAAWRRGDRRRALIVGGGAIFFVAIGSAEGLLVIWGVIRAPFFISFPYLGIVGAMAYELSSEVLRAAQIAGQLRSSEADLRATEQRMDLAASAAGLGMWVWDIVRNETWVTDHCRALFGFAPSEPVNLEKFLAKVHPDDREMVSHEVEKSLNGHGDCEVEYRVLNGDGTIRWIDGRGRVDLDGNGKPVRMHGVSLDITNRKLGEEALRESEIRFRTMANTAPVMIWMSGTDKLCTFFNTGWLDFTGRTFAQEVGNGWAEGVHRDDLDRCLKVYVNSFDARQPFTMEYRLRRIDGEYRWLLDTGTPRFASDGAFLGYVGSCIDISERKLAELDAQRHRTELAHLSRVALMGEMSASIAHELNQPLSGIVSNAGAGQRFIDRGDVDLRELRALLVDISADGRRAGEVVRGIRRMVKKEETRRQSVDLNDVVMNVAHMIGPDALLHSCKVRTSLKPNLPPVEADPIQIQQVLINLVVNGFDAMRDTPVQNREILMETKRHGNGVIEVSIRDYGVGILDEARERLFDRFFTTKREGLGMGLAIVRSIVEAHHGTIAAENAAGGGARFHFTLPVNVSH
ncbi:MAG TPA: PAS domain-containing protein [Chthoniobacterales bacterium]|jgi:PAS domain S-box-containing protein|nr:PAS domain-containing protein [Chthoniobacterales bacterium]